MSARSTKRSRVGCFVPLVAVLLTLAVAVYQDRTGPTYPLEGSLETNRGPVRFVFVRSETIGRDLPIVLVEPVPEGLRGQVRYRRYRSRDPWTSVPMERGDFRFSRRGRIQVLRGLGVALPSLKERAGKYEYFVEVAEGTAALRSVTGERPIYARYKADVPSWALVLHILAIFASLYLAMHTMVLALLGTPCQRTLLATVATLLVGGFVLGPLVQWYAFGVWWSGFPVGYDWTDNKVLVGLAFWLLALWGNTRGRSWRWAPILAGCATLAIYLVPHSIFGSEYNYITGTGHGTAG